MCTQYIYVYIMYMYLVCCCRYFFPHTVLSHMEGEEGENVLDHSDEFFSIMEVSST